jgi:hypothetical protein
MGVRVVRFATRGDVCVLTLERADDSRTLEFGAGSWRTARVPTLSLTGAAPAGGFRRSRSTA